MRNRIYKIIAVLGAFFILAVAPALVFSHEAPTGLEVSFLDVGQGDAILIKTPYGQNILIDGGPGSVVIDRLGEELPFWDRTIDLMVLTHPHDDHVYGQNAVLDRYQIKKIIYTGAVHNSPGYISWLEKIKDKNIPLFIIDRPQTIVFADDLALRVLYPFASFAGQEVENLNNTSIVARLTYKETAVLFMGDAENEVEEGLLAAAETDAEEKNQAKNKAGLRAQVLKVGHHGSVTASQEAFLKAVSPELAVIQAGEDNRFNHPNVRVINRLERIGAKIYRTDKNGTIKIFSDGAKVFAVSER